MTEHWTEETLVMDVEEARDILRQFEMSSCLIFEHDRGVGWEAETKYKDAEFRITQLGNGGANHYLCTKGEASELRFLHKAAQVLLEHTTALDMLTSYMMGGDNGLTHIEEVKRDETNWRNSHD